MTLNIQGKHLFNALQIVLLVTILGLLVWSKPWQSSSEMRKISITGQATVQAEPDEYQFSPYFEVKGKDQKVVKKQVTELANAAVDKVKNLGVQDKDLKLDANNYRWYWDKDQQGVMRVSLQIKVQDKDLAQKIQNYLLKTPAKGQLTSYESFSQEKLKNLQNEATEQAIQDARKKAEQQAKLFNAKLGEVISVEQDYQNYSGMEYYRADMKLSSSPDSGDPNLPVLPGEKGVNKTIQVVFELL